MTLIERPGAKVFYEANCRSGPWVTLVNGYTRSSSDFRVLSQRLQEKDFSTLVLDNRGSGKTTTTEEFSIEDMVGDVAAIWDHLKIEKTNVLGISMGGLISQYLSRDYQDRLIKLILVSTTSNEKYVDLTTPWGTTVESVGAKLRGFFAKDFVENNKLLIEAMVKQIHANISEGIFEKNANWQRLAVDGHYQTQGFLANLKQPTLIVHGGDDYIIKLQAAHDLKSFLPNARLEVFEGAGHLLLAEKPRELEKAILNFLLS